MVIGVVIVAVVVILIIFIAIPYYKSTYNPESTTRLSPEIPISPVVSNFDTSPTATAQLINESLK